jgi:hypothetical protein
MTKAKKETTPSQFRDIAEVRMECERKAQATLDFTGTDVPDFISDAVIDAIAAAGARTGFPTPNYDEPAAEQRRMLADLFAGTDGNFSLRKSGREALAEHIAAIMANPETPTALYNALADELASMSSRIDHNSPAMIERSLAAHALSEERVK